MGRINSQHRVDRGCHQGMGSFQYDGESPVKVTKRWKQLTGDMQYGEGAKVLSKFFETALKQLRG